MTHDQERAAYYLANYPSLWAQVEDARQEVIHSSERGKAFAKVGGNLALSDPTARKAVMLVELMEKSRTLQAVPRFLETLSMPERRLVLLVWRHGTAWRIWPVIAVRWLYGDAREAWRAIVERFALYLNRSAGAA